MIQDYSVADEEFAALQAFLQQSMTARLPPLSARPGDAGIWLTNALDSYEKVVEDMGDAFNERIGPAIAAEPLNQARLRQGCAELRPSLEALRGLELLGDSLAQSGPDMAEFGRCLRVAARDTQEQIEAWLAEVRGVFSDPVAALRARGIEPKENEHTELRLTLALKPSPALERLVEIVRKSYEPGPTEDAAPSPTEEAAPGWSWLEKALMLVALCLLFRMLF